MALWCRDLKVARIKNDRSQNIESASAWSAHGLATARIIGAARIGARSVAGSEAERASTIIENVSQAYFQYNVSRKNEATRRPKSAESSAMRMS